MELHILHLGFLKADATKMIKPLDTASIRLKYDIDNEGFISLALNALLITEGDRIVLIDPGCADFLPSRIMKEYGLEVNETLEGILHAHGVEASQVTDVLFTHLHFDHGSGAFMRKPGTICKRFPNARYHVSKEHFEYAAHPHPSESNSFFTSFFRYINRIHWLEDWSVDWMKFKVFNGHTRGLTVPVIDAGQEKVYYVSDLVPMEIFLDEQIYSGYDLDPDLIISEKRQFLSEIGDSSKIIYFHDTLIDSGYLP